MLSVGARGLTGGFLLAGWHAARWLVEVFWLQTRSNKKRRLFGANSLPLV